MYFLISKKGNNVLYVSIKNNNISFSINPIDAKFYNNKYNILSDIENFKEYNFLIESDIFNHINNFLNKKYNFILKKHYFSKKYKKFVFCCDFINEKYILNNFENIKKELNNFYIFNKLVSNGEPIIKINNIMNFYISKDKEIWYIFKTEEKKIVKFEYHNLNDLLNFIYNKIKDLKKEII